MTSPKVKFTKRLSVRLGLLSAVLATGGFAIARPFFSADSPKTTEADTPELPTTIKPIPYSDELDRIAGNSGRNEDDQWASLGRSKSTDSRLNMPSPSETVVRGNDGQVEADDQPGFLPQQPTNIRQVSGEQQNESAFVLPATPDFDSPKIDGPRFDDADTSPRQPSQFKTQSVEPKSLPEGPSFDAPSFQPSQPEQQAQPYAQAAIGDQSPAPSVYGAAPTSQNAASLEVAAGNAGITGRAASDANVYGGNPAASAALAPAVAAQAAQGNASSYDQLDSPPQAIQDTPRPISTTGSQIGGAAESPAAQPYGATPADADDGSPFADPPQPQYAPRSAPRSAPATGDFGTPAGIETAQQPYSVPAGEGSGTPGDQQFDGLQSPSLTLEKTAPAEIQVGKQARFQLKVRNVGRIPADDVIVIDRIPKGTRLVHATPQPETSPDGQLMWQLGTLPPGDEAIVTLQLMPLFEGEIGSVAQVVFQAKASVRTICTKPELTITQSGPQKVLIGNTAEFEITISNPGTGAATGVVLEEDVPAGLLHQESSHLEFAVGTLKPGESRRLKLTLTADKPGIVTNEILIRGEGNLLAKAAAQLEVIAPALQVGVSGPKLRYLERAATYNVEVANPGTAPAKEVELVTYLPKGMKFLSADHEGHYESRNHAVYWSLEELPAKQSGVAKLKLMPLEAGVQPITVEGRAELGLKHEFKTSVKVETSAELEFTIDDENDPVEVGSETVYAITLSNSGSSAATDIRIDVAVAGEMQPISGQGPTRVNVQGQAVAIEPLARLAPGEKAVYRLRVRGLREGNQRFQVQVRSAETPVAVTKEEITRIYSDN